MNKDCNCDECEQCVAQREEEKLHLQKCKTEIELKHQERLWGENGLIRSCLDESLYEGLVDDSFKADMDDEDISGDSEIDEAIIEISDTFGFIDLDQNLLDGLPNGEHQLRYYNKKLILDIAEAVKAWRKRIDNDRN